MNVNTGYYHRVLEYEPLAIFLKFIDKRLLDELKLVSIYTP